MAINIALASNGGVASALNSNGVGFEPANVINGSRTGATYGSTGTWTSSASSFPNWVQVTFDRAYDISEIDVCTIQTNYTSPIEPTLSLVTTIGIKDFLVQYWNGSSWVTVTGGTVTNNDKAWRQFTFSQVSTTAVRVTISAVQTGNYSHVTELEAWTATGADTSIPNTPTELRADSITGTTAHLSWLPALDNVGVTSYEVFRDTVSIGTSATNEYNDTGLTANTLYSYTVRAIDAATNASAQSAAMKVFTSTGGSAPTFFGVSSSPADNGTQSSSTRTSTPPANMAVGDLVTMIVQSNTVGASVDNTRIAVTGGQNWSFGQQSQINALGNIYHCRFNGTWDANPQVAQCTSIVMLVFRPTNANIFWDTILFKQIFDFVAPGTPFTVTIPGFTPSKNKNVSVAVWLTADDNTWDTLTGANWSKTGLAAQYRNLTGTGLSISVAYQLQGTAAATNNVSQNQATLGGDATSALLICFAEVPWPTSAGGSPLFVQSKGGRGDPPFDVTWNTPVTPGNSIVGIAYFETSNGGTGYPTWVISDDVGTNYTILSVVSCSEFTQGQISFCAMSVAGAPTRISISSNFPADLGGLFVQEISGAMTLQETMSMLHPVGSNTVVPRTMTARKPGSYVFAGMSTPATVPAIPFFNVTGWGATKLNEAGTGSVPVGASAYLIKPTAGALIPSIVMPSGDRVNYQVAMFSPLGTNISWIPTGGVVVGGVAPYQAGRGQVWTSTGGVIVGGGTTFAKGKVWMPVGSAIVGGAGGWVPTHVVGGVSSAVWTPTGGPIVGGAGSYARHKIWNVIGGVIVGGTSTWLSNGLRSVVWIPVSQIIVNGSGPYLRTSIVIPPVIPPYTPPMVVYGGMTGSQALDMIMARLNRTNATLRAKILLEMIQYQRLTLERGEIMPDFLIKRNYPVAVTAGNRQFLLPPDFLRELTEDETLWTPDNEGNLQHMDKISYEEGVFRYGSAGTGDLPLHYALEGGFGYVFPIPTANRILSLSYYADGGITADNNVSTAWLTNASDLLLGGVGSIITALYVKDVEAATFFVALEGRGRMRLNNEQTAREEAGRSRRMG